MFVLYIIKETDERDRDRECDVVLKWDLIMICSLVKRQNLRGKTNVEKISVGDHKIK